MKDMKESGDQIPICSFKMFFGDLGGVFFKNGILALSLGWESNKSVIIRAYVPITQIKPVIKTVNQGSAAMWGDIIPKQIKVMNGNNGDEYLIKVNDMCLFGHGLCGHGCTHNKDEVEVVILGEAVE
jgi:hypothetical protein